HTVPVDPRCERLAWPHERSEDVAQPHLRWLVREHRTRYRRAAVRLRIELDSESQRTAARTREGHDPLTRFVDPPPPRHDTRCVDDEQHPRAIVVELE